MAKGGAADAGAKGVNATGAAAGAPASACPAAASPADARHAALRRLDDVHNRVGRTIAERGLATPETPVLLMVSGGSDSTALAYIGVELHERGMVGRLAMLHVNHGIRGAAADEDAAFAAALAEALGVPFFLCEVDVPGLANAEGENLEAVARRERYAAADQALQSLCRAAGAPISAGRVFTAHTQDDRVESFYMRSIVGTGPGGFRSMRYRNGRVARPCLDVGRQDLRDYLAARAALAESADAAPVVVRDGAGALWREDATNAHTDLFRAYVRHEIVPRAQARNPQLLDVLGRTMNLIADEDDMLDAMAADAEREHVTWLDAQGCVLAPAAAALPRPLLRRVALRVLGRMLGADARVEAATVEAVCDAFADGSPVSGYTANIQGNLAVSANKRGVRIEPMAAYRARRKRG